MPHEDTDRLEAYAARTALAELFGETPKVTILAALLAERDRDLNVAGIADLAGVHRTTVYDHLDDLVELGAVEHTRTVSGGRMYRIDGDSEVAADVADLAVDLLDVLAREE